MDIVFCKITNAAAGQLADCTAGVKMPKLANAIVIDKYSNQM